MAEALAPGQSEALLQIAQLNSKIEDTRVRDKTISNEMVQNLKQIYGMYVKQKMPFIEQVRLLSLLPRSWSYEKTSEIFGCSSRAIKAAHRMYDDHEYMLKRDIQVPWVW